MVTDARTSTGHPPSRRAPAEVTSALVWRVALIILAMAFWSANPSAKAQDIKASEPILDPTTGSYFQVLETRSAEWSTARRIAEARSHQGRRGRLAIIKSRKTYEWLVNQFDFDHETWFGLRYLCGRRKSFWIDNSELGPRDFQIWHPNWVRDPNVTCFNQTDLSYMPVYITFKKYDVPVVWQTTGPKKGFKGILVEYPSG